MLTPRLPNVAAVLIVLIALLVTQGCGQLAYRLDRRAPEQFIPNPLELPPLDDQFVWSQVVDTVDDYFRISREQPVQNSNNFLLDGRVETSYRVGASVLEPWRKDSTAGFEALQSTLQSIRRKATVIVRPRGAGYTVEVIVQKDLEDTDRTQYATETTATRRHDGTIVRQVGGAGDSPQTLGWISLGRDTSLEQRILRDIFQRVTEQDARRAHL
ncbi:hypothetical protein Enr13x_28380 [Stieleria neptunia]|uniref:ABC-type transport auxiliary lipoprotein component domain-containing protein n=1 Tax=Stieleria neptunia TaxID=2527979 RepID=A0A518HQ63_9BACT|nr:hypothetical protein [Stieleria neptunia]QDV42986.1 hypothetical protein Enr13x_28380 [Stieleria neptunia]